MPDDRLLHRCLGHSEKVNRLTDFERLVWLMYKLASDDFGVMRFSAVTIQEAAEWLEKRPARLVQKALEQVHGVGLVDTFTHQGRTYCYQPTWQTWQKITYPRSTSQPLPPVSLVEACDLHTRWLFAHHPKGGKLKSWQAPEDFDSGKTPGIIREALPELSGPVFVRSVCVGVGTKDQNLPTPKARRDTFTVENSGSPNPSTTSTVESHEDTQAARPQADSVPPALRPREDDPSARAHDRRRGVESSGSGHDCEVGISASSAGHARQGDGAGRASAPADGGAAQVGEAAPVAGDDTGGTTVATSAIAGQDEQAGGLGSRSRSDGGTSGIQRLRAHVAAAVGAKGNPTYH